MRMAGGDPATADDGWATNEHRPPESDHNCADWGPLVNLHYLRSELSRRRRIWRATAALGLLLGVALPMRVAPTRAASATVLLTHDPRQDAAPAMSTDV